jgi:hypothetical protein
MSRALLAVGTMVLALCAFRATAAEEAAATPTAPDWHYRWHENQWWYWMPESRQWMIWTGSEWRPYGEGQSCPQSAAANRSSGAAVSYVSAETSHASGTSEPAYTYRIPESCPAGSNSNYAGYGWSWGPGTALRDGPGGRF